jgi:hypothetical protein
VQSINYQSHATVNRFRRARGLILREQIRHLAKYFGRDIVILDVGGRPDYWLNLGFENIARIDLLNASQGELDRALPEGLPENIFTRQIGDARNLTGYADGSVDLVHSNSVIEHVGGWLDMQAMASELRRVGRAGWVQTPAWSFPIEPHFHTPFMHWFGAPMRARMLSFSLGRRFRRMDLAKRRERVESINLLTRAELAALFPDSDIDTERFLLLAKSYVARWMPNAEAGAEAVRTAEPSRAAS